VPPHLTYLVFELVWALPVLALQWLAGAGTLRRCWRVLLLGVTVPTLYLCFADAVAIHMGIWRIRPQRTSGLKVAGLPIEEVLFFLCTNLMIVQTVILVRNAKENARIVGLLRLWRRWRRPLPSSLSDVWSAPP